MNLQRIGEFLRYPGRTVSKIANIGGSSSKNKKNRSILRIRRKFNKPDAACDLSGELPEESGSYKGKNVDIVV